MWHRTPGRVLELHQLELSRSCPKTSAASEAKEVALAS